MMHSNLKQRRVNQLMMNSNRVLKSWLQQNMQRAVLVVKTNPVTKMATPRVIWLTLRYQVLILFQHIHSFMFLCDILMCVYFSLAT